MLKMTFFLVDWSYSPWPKSGKHDIDYMLLCSSEVIIAHEIVSVQFTKLGKMNEDGRTLL